MFKKRIAIFVPRERYNRIFRTSEASARGGSKNRGCTNPEVRTMVFATRGSKTSNLRPVFLGPSVRYFCGILVVRVMWRSLMIVIGGWLGWLGTKRRQLFPYFMQKRSRYEKSIFSTLVVLPTQQFPYFMRNDKKSAVTTHDFSYLLRGGEKHTFRTRVAKT